jgi:hypothetical protein
MAAFQISGFAANGRSQEESMSVMGTLLSVTTGRFQEVRFLRPLPGDEFRKATVS